MCIHIQKIYIHTNAHTHYVQRSVHVWISRQIQNHKQSSTDMQFHRISIRFMQVTAKTYRLCVTPNQPFASTRLVCASITPRSHCTPRHVSCHQRCSENAAPHFLPNCLLQGSFGTLSDFCASSLGKGDANQREGLGVAAEGQSARSVNQKNPKATRSSSQPKAHPAPGFWAQG